MRDGIMIPAVFHISLDIDDAFSQASMNLCQGESGRIAAISLRQSGRAFPVGDDCRAVCAGTRPDGSVFFIDCSIENGLIICAFSALHTACPGVVRAEIRLYGSGEVLIASPAFTLEIRESAMEDGPIAQGAEATALTQLLQETDTAIKTMQTETAEAISDMETATDEAIDRMQATSITAAEVSVDNSVGEPAATVELIPGEDGQTLRFLLSNLKGDKGDKGEKGEKGDSPVVIEGKMEKENPSGYGSISVNRKADSEVGEFSVAIGKDNIASGYASYAEGCNTVASDKYAHAEGYGCEASGDNAHAEGRNTVASGLHTHAEGCGCKADQAVTHAEGWYTSAFGQYSHVEGDHSETRGSISHAEGLYTQANGSCQHVQGKYNIADDADKYAHIVGNGTDVNNRSNAHTVDWQGNAWFSGQVFMGGTGMDDPRAMKLGSGGYVIHVPASDITVEDETGNTSINLTESYDNFAPVAAAGGSVWLDLSEHPMYKAEGLDLLLLPVMAFVYSQMFNGLMMVSLDAISGLAIQVSCMNGTWTPGGTT